MQGQCGGFPRAKRGILDFGERGVGSPDGKHSFMGMGISKGHGAVQHMPVDKCKGRWCLCSCRVSAPGAAQPTIY